MDCSGVPNGPNVTDLCGKCRNPSAADFNQGCGVKLGTFQPLVGYYGGVDVDVETSSLEGVSTVICSFNK